jgi:hypothetical protein
MAKITYYSGTEELKAPCGMDNKEFAARFPGVVGKRYDSFQKLVGFSKDALALDVWKLVGAKPVTRVIEFKSNPSLHKCDARCQSAKGHSCECSCGGKYHGAGVAA